MMDWEKHKRATVAPTPKPPTLQLRVTKCGEGVQLMVEHMGIEFVDVNII